MSTSVKINSLELLDTVEYELVGFDLPYSLVKAHFKEITLKLICNGVTVDGAIANEKLIFDELYKIKPDKRDCILKIKLDGSANTTYYDIVSYRLESRNIFVLVTNKKIVLEIILTVLNYGYAASWALGNEGVPHATKTLPNYFDCSDITAIKGEINAYSELNMKLLSADDVDSIYYGIKSEKLISDITNFIPILEAEDQTLTNATKVVNLNANPSIEVDTSGYLAGSSVISRDIVEFYKGVASLKCITDNNAATEGWFRTITTTTSAGTEYTFSVYLKGSGTVYLRFWDDITGNQTGDIITLNGDWTRYSLTKTFGVASTNRKLYIITDVQQDITFYSDAIMHTEGATLYPYFTGDARNNSSAYTNATYPTADWLTYIKFSLNNANYKGRYLILARVYNEIYDAPIDFIKIRIKYGSMYNDEYSFSNEETSQWQLIELGEIKVPYSETQTTSSDYEIQLKGEYGTNRFVIDYIVLLPIDETFGIRKTEILAITQNDIYKIDTLNKIPSVLLQNINDNNNYDRGNFIYLPKGDCRIVVVSNNNNGNEITDQMSFWLNYYSRYFYLRGDD